MRTNIELAIEGLITSNKDITLANILPAYFREAGFGEMTLDALTSFEHALDKYPRRFEVPHAAFAERVLRISAEYWSTKSAAFDGTKCNMCDNCACRLFSLKLDNPKTGLMASEHPRHLEVERREVENALIPKRDVKSKKKRGRRVHGKQDVTSAGFDPYAPSTSAVVL